jgi:hypothetical protein
MSKKETVEEFLARGGKITKVEYSEPSVKETVNSAPTSGYSSIMTYDSADLYYGDPKKTSAPRESVAAKSKKQPNIDFSVLPPELQKSLLEQLASHGEEQ